MHNFSSLFSLLGTWDSRLVFEFFQGEISNISFIITGSRQVNLNGEMLESHNEGHALLKWHLRKNLDTEDSGHQKWNCVALIFMYDNSIGQHVGQKMRLSLSSNEQATVNTRLIPIQED